NEVDSGPFNSVSLATPLVHYQFEGNMNNSGSGAATYDASNDGSGANLSYETTGGIGQGQYLKLNNGDLSSTGDGDRVVIPIEIASLDHGTMSFWLREDQRYYYNSIFNCPANSGDWEMWIYGGDGTRADLYKGRIDSGDVCTNPALNENGNGGLDVWNHFTWRWVQEESGSCHYQLFLNGELVDSCTGGSWAESGMQFFLGGGNGNDYATWSMDDFRIYNVCLDEDGIRALAAEVPEPSTIILILSALAGLVFFARKR
ncbi:MAG: PEP-CTERM sorting domain-containing protein, partial [Planctomycetia bacterium]